MMAGPGAIATTLLLTRDAGSMLEASPCHRDRAGGCCLRGLHPVGLAPAFLAAHRKACLARARHTARGLFGAVRDQWDRGRPGDLRRWDNPLAVDRTGRDIGWYPCAWAGSAHDPLRSRSPAGCCCSGYSYQMIFGEWSRQFAMSTGGGRARRRRQAIIDACRRMNTLGINQGTSGNISVRFGNGLLITPTSVPYDGQTPAMVHGDGRSQDAQPEAVSEWRFWKPDLRPRRASSSAIAPIAGGRSGGPEMPVHHDRGRPAAAASACARPIRH